MMLDWIHTATVNGYVLMLIPELAFWATVVATVAVPLGIAWLVNQPQPEPDADTWRAVEATINAPGAVAQRRARGRRR